VGKHFRMPWKNIGHLGLGTRAIQSDWT